MLRKMMEMNVENHGLWVEKHKLCGEGVMQFYNQKNSSLMDVVDTIIIHTNYGVCPLSSVHKQTVSFTDYAAHVLIDGAGNCYQFNPFNVRGHHAGKGMVMGRKRPDDFSIGVELFNGLKLFRKRGKFYTIYKREVPREEVYEHEERGRVTYWQRYTSIQMDRAVEVCITLMRNYPIRYVMRHCEVINKKIDPGPAFDWEVFLKRLDIDVIWL